MKKILFIILLGLLPMVASANGYYEPTTGYDAIVNGICYKFSGDEASVSYAVYDPNDPYIPFISYYSGNVVIPDSVTYNGKTYCVTSIGASAFAYCKNLNTVIIPESVKSIGELAFSSSSLTSITIPGNVKTIGQYAFDECTSLKSVVIGEGVTSIGEQAFLQCTSLTSANIPGSVTSFDYIFEKCTALSSVTLGEGLTSIGSFAFKDCSSLTSINIPESVTSIGAWAFEKCSNLSTITIPDGVTSVGLYAFIGTPWYNNLPDGLIYIGRVAYTYKGKMPEKTQITIKEGTTEITTAAFRNQIQLFSIILPESLTSIGSEAFEYCSGLASVTIPSRVTIIGEYAFSGCFFTADAFVNKSTLTSQSNWGATFCEKETDDGLLISNDILRRCRPWVTSATIPETMAYISSSAFEGCELLTSIIMPQNIKSINAYTFNGCLSLNSITIPESVTNIGYAAFNNCKSLTSITIPNSVTSVDKQVFSGCSSLTSVTISRNMTSIRDAFFMGCSSLTSIILPENIKSVSNYAFSGCRSLTNVVLRKGLTNIGQRAFHDCSSLTSITIPGTVPSIGVEAFAGCTNLTTITIPNSVTRIDKGAFQNCSSLKKVYCQAENVPATDKEAFAETPIASATLYVPTGCSDSYNSATSWSSFGSIVALDEFPSYNIYFDDANVKAICVANWDTDRNGELSETEAADVSDLGEVFKGNTAITLFSELMYFTGLTSIADDAFLGCSNLTSVSLPDSVKVIGSAAFQNCSSLTSIKIPNGVTSIGSAAFQNCSSLTSVGIPNELKSIDSDVFRGCSGLTTVIIPESVQGIGVQAFADCTGLTSVDISSSVTAIAAHAFQNCGSLAEVYCRAENVPETGGDAFEGTPITSAMLYVPVGSIGLYKETAPWSKFGSFVILPIKINEENFPDTNFRKWLLNNTEYGKDGVLMYEEISEVTVINIKGKSIVNLKGIEFFFALKELTCSSNNLAKLDMSGCPMLEKLDCASNKSLTSLNVSKNKLLNSLICDWNTKLTVLDVSQNTELNYLNCERNYFMAELYLPKGPSLTSLRCRYTKVTKLDVSGCTALPSLDCSDNKLTSLDVSGCTALTSLNCSNNNLVELRMTDTPLTSLNCLSNKLTSIDLSGNTELTSLNCGNNKLTSLDLSNNTALSSITCDNNQLTTLDVSRNTALTQLNFSHNNLTGYDLSANTALTSLNCSYNPLTTFDVSKNTALTSLDCNNSQLTALDVSQNTELETLRCGNNSLKAIDVSKNTKLKKLECYNNQLTRLDVSGCVELQELNCYLNQIKDAAMDLLVESLPTVSAGNMRVFSTKEDWPAEHNVMTTTQVAAANAKGWRTYIYVYDWDSYDQVGYIWETYSGSKPKQVVNFTAGQMATIILPDAPDASKGWYYRLDRCEDNKIFFEQELQPQARTPYIIVPSEDFSIDLGALNLEGLTQDEVSIKGISFIGSYIGEVLPALTGGDEGGSFYIDIIDATSDCLIAELDTEKSVIGALRAYLQVSWDDPYNPGGTKGPGEKKEIVLKDDPNGISSLTSDPSPVREGSIFDLQGRHLNTLPLKGAGGSGIYIIDGKKVLVK